MTLVRLCSPGSLAFASKPTLPSPDTGLCSSRSPTVKSIDKPSGDFAMTKAAFQYITRQ
jgi:hypothetical protein